jgi:hypothetical protein
MPAREYLRWQRYWAEESWGPYRDNLHAAMIVSELLKPHLREGAKISMLDYMLKPSEERQADSAASLIRSLELAEYQQRRAARRAERRKKT